MTHQTRNHHARHRGAAITVLVATLAIAAAAQDRQGAEQDTEEPYTPAFTEAEAVLRLRSTADELARWTGTVPVWTTGTVHPVTTADWFLDPARTVMGGTVLPGAPFAPVVTKDADVVKKDGMVKLRLTGWQRTDEPGILHGGAGAHAVLATLGGAAQAARVTGVAVTLSPTGETWQPVDLQGWIAEADLTARPAALWDHAQALYTAKCALCHAAVRPDAFDANTWSGQFDAMLPYTDLRQDQARLVKTYLQLHAAEPSTEASGAPQAMGQLVYERNCRSCHGKDARQGSGGSIRGSDVHAVRNAVGGYETMPQIVLTETGIRAVAAYLTGLADGP